VYNKWSSGLLRQGLCMKQIRIAQLKSILGWALIASVMVSSPALSELKLLITKDGQVGRFVVDGAATYATTTQLLSLNVFSGETTTGGDNPLFCFDYSTETPTIAIELNSATSASDERLLAPELALASAVQYQLSGSTISIAPADTVACFFRAYDATSGGLQTAFGLYGQAPSNGAAPAAVGDIFSDSFSGLVALSVEISKPERNPNGTVSYTITASNGSAFPVSSMALQQSVPYGVDVSLEACQINGQAAPSVCNNASQDTLRFFDFELASGEELELAVTASRNGDWNLGPTVQSVPIYVAFMASTADGFAYAVAQRTIAPE